MFFSINGGWPQNWYMFPVGYCEDLPPLQGEFTPPWGGEKFFKIFFFNFFIFQVLGLGHIPWAAGVQCSNEFACDYNS